jgi:23S rRNA pseudouridine2605 synthase
MRINKYLSHNTKYSRREADQLVKDGRVKINKKVITTFENITKDDLVFLDDKIVRVKDKYTVIVYNKAKGELVTKKDPRGRKVIYDTLENKYKNFISIGRLDFSSEGVLLMTDSPTIADKLQTSQLERVYNIKINGMVTDSMIKAMKTGIEIENSIAGAHKLTEQTSMTIAPFFAFQVLKNSNNFSRLRVAIGEGKNRELRRFFGFFNKEVLDLKRVSFAGVELNSLPTGKSRYLSSKEYSNLREFLDNLDTIKNKKS